MENLVKPLFQYETVDLNTNPVPVIIVAAGSSSRMKGINKQFLEVSGEPVILKTIKCFNNCKFVSRIIVVTKQENILSIEKLCSDFCVNKVTDIVSGGNTRHESVLNGMKMLTENENFVLIHDGARPFVDDSIIGSVVRALQTADCALAAIKVTDTVKQIDGEDMVIGTADRSKLYLAQTPQGVNVKKYLKASGNYAHEDFTDDASVMEISGCKVVVCKGSRYNIKITTPEDIVFADAIDKKLKEKSQ